MEVKISMQCTGFLNFSEINATQTETDYVLTFKRSKKVVRKRNDF